MVTTNTTVPQVHAVVETLNYARGCGELSDELLLDLCKGLVRMEKRLESYELGEGPEDSNTPICVANNLRRSLLEKMSEPF